MTNEQLIKANIAIHSGAAAAAAIGAGLAQLPGSDNPPIVAVQITMAIALGPIFDVQVSETGGRVMVMTALATMTGPVIARIVTKFSPAGFLAPAIRSMPQPPHLAFRRSSFFL